MASKRRATERLYYHPCEALTTRYSMRSSLRTKESPSSSIRSTTFTCSSLSATILSSINKTSNNSTASAWTYTQPSRSSSKSIATSPRSQTGISMISSDSFRRMSSIPCSTITARYSDSGILETKSTNAPRTSKNRSRRSLMNLEISSANSLITSRNLSKEAHMQPTMKCSM